MPEQSRTADRVLEVADELYGLPLPEFTPTRDARAKEMRAEDKQAAAAVKALRKPSAAGWVVNLLVRRETEQVDQVLAVGAGLRDAQEQMDAGGLRELTRQRRQLTAAVTHIARRLAGEAGHRVSDSVAEQVEATLTAAMVSADAAEAVRSGLLVAAMSSTGVDEVDVAAAVALPEALGFSATPRTAPEPRGESEPGPPTLHVVRDPDADRKALEEARARLDEAQAVLDTESRGQADATAEVTRLEAEAMQSEAELTELRSKLAEAEEYAEQVEAQLAEAEDARTAAADAVREAAAERDRARSAVDRLQGRVRSGRPG